MRKAIFLSVLTVFVLSTLAIAQNAPANGGQTSTNVCQGVTCSESTLTCPDGYVATCSNSCDSSTGQCSQCTPSCSGHEKSFCETTQCGSNEKTCPDGFRAVCQKQCDNAALKCIDCEPSCAGHEPTTQPTCPSPPAKPTCAQGEYVYTNYDANRCIVSYECKTSTSCPAVQPISCTDGKLEVQYDQNGCIVKQECKSDYISTGSGTYKNAKWECYDGSSRSQGDATSCKYSEDWRRYAEDYCRDRCNADKSKCGVNSFSAGELCGAGGTCGNNICEGDEYKYCQQDCESTTGPKKCGDTICDVGEDAYNCPSDCKVPGRSCPLTIQCSDGSQAACRQDGDRCQCGQCPITNLPPDCRQEKDEKGFITVRCERKEECREISQEERIACTEKGGVPVFRKDPGGCKRFECSSGSGGSLFTSQPSLCPSGNEVKKGIDKCFELGLRGVVKYEAGCPVPTCIEKEKGQCQEPSPEERQRMDNECTSRGGRLTRFVNRDGCQQVICREERSCQRELPEDAYRACGAKGGEIAVKRDQSGCVVFSDCLRRGNIEESYVEESGRKLDPAELLQIALKLEKLKVELDKLARETKNIADYYKSTGSSEEERFSRVSGMFAAATEKIDEIKDKIRSSADDMEREDLREIRSDIKYVKDVMIKDILYMMLSNGDDVKKIKERSSTDCGEDGGCFDDALRLCKPIKFYPEGDEGPEVTITGLEDGKCVMKAVLPADKGPPAGVVPGGPPWEMTCKLEKYALGVRNPEEDIFPYCQGSMLELIKRFGTPEKGKGGPGIPGKCSGAECRQYCSRGPAEAKECLEKMGQYLPEEAIKGLKHLAEGGSYSGSDYEGDYNYQYQQESYPGGYPPSTATTSPQQEPAACVGCLSNGVCDPGECSGCPDCTRQ